MKLTVGGGITDTNCTVAQGFFRIAPSAIAFEILSSRLYSNPVLAIVRELLTNAYDSHKAAKNLETPIKVNFPDTLNKNFVIRDFGVGLSQEDVMTMYTTFFHSTKSNTNDFTGCFGLGSKTPFSYAPTFSVNSYWNGTKYYFLATKKDGLPSIYCIRDEETDEPNGLEIVIPTDGDTNFLQEGRNYLKFMPEIVVESNKAVEQEQPTHRLQNVVIYPKKDRYSYHTFSNLMIKQGQNIYNVHDILNNKANNLKTDTIRKMLNKSIIIIDAPIGTLDITPSRESLSRDPVNLDKIANFIEHTEEELKKLIATRHDVIKDLDVTIYNQLITEKYFDKDTAFISEISGSKNMDVSLRKCYIKHFTTEGQTNLTSFNQNKGLILVAPDFLTGKAITKLKNTLINHEDEIDDPDCIYVVSPYNLFGNHNNNLLTFFREIQKIVFTLNKITEYSFNFDVMTLSRFYRMYPNSKGRRNTGKQEFQKRNIYYFKHLIPTWQRKNTSNSSWSEWKSTDEIRNIKSKFPIENTIIIESESNSSKSYGNAHLVELIHLCLHKLRDLNGKNFMYDYLKKKLPKLPYGPVLDDGSPNGIYLNVIFVAKTNIQFFRQYIRLSKNEIVSLVRDSNYIVKTTNKDYTKDSAHVFKTWRDILYFNFTGKAGDYVQNTATYKQLDILAKVTEKHDNDVKANHLNSDDIQALRRFQLPETSNQQVITQVLSKLPEKIQWLKNHVFSKSHGRRDFRNKLNGRYDRNAGETYIHSLNPLYKLRVLRILKGEVSDVLF